MPISFNTGTTAVVTGSGTASGTMTIPAGVLAGDVILVLVDCFTTATGTLSQALTSTATAPVQVGVNENTAFVNAAQQLGTVWVIKATGADAGATLTYTVTGGTGGSYWFANCLAAYTGASNVIDVIQGSQSTLSATGGGNATTPTAVTSIGNDWHISLVGIGVAAGNGSTTPAGLTLRESALTQGVFSAIADGNASAGPGGTTIGGAAWGANVAQTQNQWNTLFTVGLAPASNVAPNAPPIPLIPPHPHFTRALLEEAWSRADWQAQGVADLTVAFSSTSGGIDTYNVTSPWNGGTQQQMRVLKPTAPNTNYPHAFLIMLPVEGNQGTTFGDSIGTAQTLGAHNTYNLTCVQPGYAGTAGNVPWYADNPLDPTISQEKYTLLVLNWIKANLATAGAERVYLIGFSKSGIGGQGLQFRHPDLFAATASWDAPFMMTDYDGTDPTNGGAVGGNPAGSYGTSSSFQTKYELTAAHLAGWQATGQYGVNRIWIGLGPTFQADTPAYDAALTAAQIPHTYTFSNTVESHAWHTDWVAAALASIIPSNEPTVFPQQYASHPLFTRLLEVAAYRLEGQGIAPVPPAGSVPVLMAARTEVISRVTGRVIRR